MKPWINLFEEGSDKGIALEGSEWNAVVAALVRYHESGRDEILQVRGRGGGISLLTVSRISSAHFFTPETWESMIRVDADFEAQRQKIRKQFPELED